MANKKFQRLLIIILSVLPTISARAADKMEGVMKPGETVNVGGESAEYVIHRAAAEKLVADACGDVSKENLGVKIDEESQEVTFSCLNSASVVRPFSQVSFIEKNIDD